MTTSTNVFEQYDNTKIATALYPAETITFLTGLFATIKQVFNPKLKLEDQILGKNKQQYESMLVYILEHFKDIDTLKKSKSSVKYLISRVLETYIFKGLDMIYNYNLYSEPTVRSDRTQLENALDHIYSCNLHGDSYVLPKEINTLIIDGTVITDPEEITKNLFSSTKKMNYTYGLGVNMEWNKKHPEQRITQVFENLDIVTLESPVAPVLDLSTVGWGTDENLTSKIVDKKQLFRLLLENTGYYMSRNGVLRKFDGIRCVFTTDFEKLTRVSNFQLKDKVSDLTFNLSPSIWTKYNTLFATEFIRKFEDGAFSEKKYSVSSDFHIIQSLVQYKLPLVPKSRFGEFETSIFPVKLIIDQQEYTTLSEIYSQLKKIPETKIFKVVYENGDSSLMCKDLNYMYLLNTDLIESYIYEKQLTLEQQDRVLISPVLITSQYFFKYISNFLTTDLTNYQTNYQEMKLLNIMSKNFTKNDITKYSRSYKNKIDKLESLLDIGHVLPKGLELEEA